MKKKMVSVLLTASMLAGMTMFAVPVMAGMTISRRFLTDHLKKPIQMITKESYS